MKYIIGTKAIYVMIAIFLVSAMASCGNDDGDKGQGNIVPTTVFNGKRLVKIIKDVEYPEDNWYYEFKYDGRNRLTQVTEYYEGRINDGYQYNISYDANSVIISFHKDTFTFKLNGKGYAVSVEGPLNRTFEYDSEGHMTRNGNLSLTWEDGNMVKYEPISNLVPEDPASPMAFVYDSEDMDNRTFGPWINYTIYDGSFYSEGEDYYDVLDIAYLCGIMGKGSKNRPSYYYDADASNPYYSYYGISLNEDGKVAFTDDGYSRSEYVYE